jgi:hypothetical protein
MFPELTREEVQAVIDSVVAWDKAYSGHGARDTGHGTRDPGLRDGNDE